VVQRQPTDDHIVRVEVDAEACADQLLIGYQIAVADLHALGQGGGTGSVLQEGDVARAQYRRVPALGQRRVKRIYREQFRRVVAGQSFEILQAAVQRTNGQQQARFGVVDDRQQALLVMAA